MAKKSKWLIGVVIVGIAIVALSFLNLGNNLVYFYTPSEAVAKAAELQDREIRIGAMVKAGSVQWNPERLNLRFVATDLKGHEINVEHAGSPPDMFKEGQGVVVEGYLKGDGAQFKANNLFVKHSEEYKKPDDHAQMDKAYLEKSLFKNDK